MAMWKVLNSSPFSHLFLGFRDIEEFVDLAEFAGAGEPMQVLDFISSPSFPT